MLASRERRTTEEITLTTTVAKEYVHRAAVSEVFLTGWRENAPDTFTVTAQWPRCHTFYDTEHGMHDPLLLCETIRQMLPLLSHAAYGVPFGYQLSWSHFLFALDPRAMRAERTPTELELHVRCHDIRHQRGLPAAMSMDIVAFRDGEFLTSASTRFGCHAPQLYRRLRRGRGDVPSVFASAPAPTEPLPCARTGRSRRSDVVLSEVPGSSAWRLRVDTGHPTLFDHPVDHVPGMLLLEAARQAAHAAHEPSGPVMVTSMEVAFNRYVEFDTQCLIETRREPGVAPQPTIRVDARQGDDLAFTASATLAELGRL
ncbi:ScbA/BarX family gamma-butyrolactone biosynthesis protein [Streptomyces sp. MS06]|uniref:ScbA/BarX family gamma-butyrolactone biosynthesis protein n=1 Tax=Streptomyces sp. MS06 TaxID=3385974 RepID=UPI0039A1D87A